MASPEADPRGWLDAMIKARESGRQELQEENTKLKATIVAMQRNIPLVPPPIHDQLREIVTHGDLIIRRVNNGHVIRRVDTHGNMIETWVVEGDLTEVAKQLTAIQSIDAMNASDQHSENATASIVGALAGFQRASNAAAATLMDLTPGGASYKAAP